MQKRISYCPFCGSKFRMVTDIPDAHSVRGYQCEGCNEVLELRVNRFPLASSR